MAEAESKNSIQVIERMSHLLEVLAQHPQPVSLKLLAQGANLHPSTAHRILNALVNGRIVERVDQGSYRLGIRLLELGNLVKARISVREHALPFMRELHAATGEAVNLSVRRDDEIVYVERTSSGRAMMRVVNIVDARRCTSQPLASCFSPRKARAACAPTPSERSCPHIPAPRSHRAPRSSARSKRFASRASRSTRKKPKSACAASAPACATTPV